jgi:hypothetical protein
MAAAKLQRRFDALVAGHRGPVICAGASCSAIFPPRDFFLKIPPTEKVSANAVTDRTLRRQSCARGCCCANAATRTLAVFACLLFASSDHDIASCSVLVEGRATVDTPALPWFHQRHRSCAARGTLFVRVRLVLRLRGPRHYAGHRAVGCDLRSTLTVPLPSFMPPFPRNLGHKNGLWLAKSRLAS